MATTDELSAKAKEVLACGMGQAHEILSSNEKVNELLSSARRSLNSNKMAKEAMENLVLVLDMLEDYIKGNYTTVPKNSIAAVVVALVYWINPLDLIPDIVPGVGLLDDAAVLAACIAFMGEDVRIYKEWKEAQDNF